MDAIVGRELGGAGDRRGDGLADVLDRAQSGDVQAFEELVATHERAVLRTARALLGNREDALDAAQEVFLRVFRHLGRFDRRREFSPWLYRVAVNVCRDIHRRRARIPTAPLDALDPALLATPGDQEASADARERQRAVRRALALLSDREREAVVLRDVEGLSTAEVARALGCLEVTVRSHLSRGRLKLQAALAGPEGEGA